MKDKVLALAEELDGVSVKENCEACLASGTDMCRGDLECVESAHKACAKRLRAIVEHEAEDVTTVSAYDLLPDEDRRAIAWVREHGGLDAVEKRLMPEGMEWPRFESGEPVRIGDDAMDELRGTSDVVFTVSFSRNTFAFLSQECAVITQARSGTPVKRPSPKAIAADGKPLREGEMVYWLEKPLPHRVVKTGGVLPLDIDPECTVEIEPKGHAETHLWVTPDSLSHERPQTDTWELLEQEAKGSAAGYCSRYGLDVERNAFGQAKAADLVRRCRALAERGGR